MGDCRGGAPVPALRLKELPITNYQLPTINYQLSFVSPASICMEEAANSP
ncbi:MAG: hypothetical protein HC894_14190 [Microcoleus sp. SM1_3_4]|nr:hypothetical protein [Microcoleus sp. SM1_3_4]